MDFRKVIYSPPFYFLPANKREKTRKNIQSFYFSCNFAFIRGQISWYFKIKRGSEDGLAKRLFYLRLVFG